MIQNLFGRLITEGETECLYVLSARFFAVPLTLNGYANKAADGFWQYLEFVESNALSEFVVRGVADAWDDCWPGLAELNTDESWYMQRVIEANRERNRLAKILPADMVPKPRSATFDTEERRMQWERLRRLAVPIVKAYALWGWGREVVPDAVVLSLAPALVSTSVTLPVHSAAPSKRIARKDMAPEMTGQRLSEMRNALKGPALTLQLVTRTGLPEREIRRREKQWHDSRNNPITANAFTTVTPAGAGTRGNKR